MAATHVAGARETRFEELTKQGRVHGHREYFSVTGAEGGFMIVEGEVSELLALSGEEDTLRLNGKAASVVQDFEVQVFAGGSDQAIQQMVGNYVGGLQELGYM